ncbi:spread protein [Dactylosporangium sp. CA-092794]|uniref:spread protein n=1 Tax=Dactylosporangium sp. CA-092794 TaxID=3239929 RepID=UPI003D90ACC2
MTGTTPPPATGGEPDRRFYRLRAPDTEHGSSAVTVRVTDGDDLYVAVGGGRRRMYLTVAEAWALWRCLSEAVASTGQPPEWIRVPVVPKGR